MTKQYDDNGKISDCILEKGEYVIFSDGRKEGRCEARWSCQDGAFISFFDDNGEEREDPLLSTEIIKVERKKSECKKQTDTSKMKQIFPYGETEKAYQVEDGSNGCVSRGNMRQYYKYYAKSICVVEDGKIYAPIWA